MNQQDKLFNKYHYNRAKIYKLCCKDPNITDIYVGSTLNHYRRKNQHKSRCNNPNSKSYNFHVYKFIRNNGGFDNWNIIVLEEYEAKNKNDLLWKEREWIDKLLPTLNCFKPIITRVEKLEYDKEKSKERYQNNKEKISEQSKEYRKNNKEKILEQKKEYYENNKEKISERKKEYYENNKEKCLEQMKEYRENNKEKLSEYYKEYRKNNKEKILEQKKEKVECEICKVFMSRASLTAHKKSKKHLQNINQ